MSSRSGVLTGEQEPRVWLFPASEGSDGADACEFAARYGLTADPWQELVVVDWLAFAADGRFASLTCVMSAPRQNGKNVAVEIRELYGMVVLGERILHTAHEVKTQRKAFKRLLSFFGDEVDDLNAPFPELNALVKEIRKTNGQEAIILKSGASIEFIARTKSSGRGFTVDVIVFDESQEMSDDALEALLSTTSAAPLGNPQWLFLGTPPGPLANGEVFTRTRQAVIDGTDARGCLHEWSAPADCDLDDPESWAVANPGLGLRLQMTVIKAERQRFTEQGFARERLGMWEAAANAEVIPGVEWLAVEDVHSLPVAELTLAVDVSPDRQQASVGLAGRRADGVWHVEIDEQRAGTAWILPYVIETCGRNKQIKTVVVDGTSPAGSMIGDLERANIHVTKTGSRDMADACGAIYDAVMYRDEHGTIGQVRHIGQPQLTYSLSQARKREIAGTGAWGWNRRSPDTDITGVVAVTLALWGAMNVKRRRRALKSTNTRRRVVVLS